MPPLNEHETAQVRGLFATLTSSFERELAGSPVQGLAHHEIEEIRADQGVESLPAYYREFLHCMGHRAGRLLIFTDAFNPALLE